MRRPLPDRQGDQVCATANLVAPLAASKATEMRTTDIAALPKDRSRSCAVTPPIGGRLRWSDLHSANFRSTQATPTTRTPRTSTMATRTTGTRTTTPSVLAPSADWHHAASFSELAAAYFDCRRHKRNTASALAFELDLERNLAALHSGLVAGTYAPGQSICFVITHPKPREVWAADFRDRIVHHLLYNRIAPLFYRRFIADSCACIPGRGTLYAVERLEAKVRSASQNWSRPCYYLKCDLANFFVSIDKEILFDLLCKQVPAGWWRELMRAVVFHDPRTNVSVRGAPELLALIPAHKSLFNQTADRGLPIGNLSSQFFANVYLDVLDQFVKHRLRVRHYIRYVDDFVLLHESPQFLNDCKAQIETLLRDRLAMELNPRKTILQLVPRGIDFVGQVIKPWRRTLRRRTLNQAMCRVATIPPAELATTATSYFAQLRQCTRSHIDRRRLARLCTQRELTVDGALSKAVGP